MSMQRCIIEIYHCTVQFSSPEHDSKKEGPIKSIKTNSFGMTLLFTLIMTFVTLGDNNVSFSEPNHTRALSIWSENWQFTGTGCTQ